MFAARARLGAALVPAAILVVGITLTVGFSLQLRRDVDRQQTERLTESARQTTNLFTTVSQSVTALLTTGGVVAESTGGDPKAVARAVGPRLGTTLLANVVVFSVTPRGVRRVGWTGRSAPVLFQQPDAAERRVLRQAASAGKLLVVGQGVRAGVKVIGVATASAPGSRYAAYGEIAVPKAVSFGNLKGAEFALYVGSESPSNLIATNATSLPIRGRRIVQRLDSPLLGQTPVMIYARPRKLTLESTAPWAVLGIGVLLSILLAAQFETMRRRRDAALHQARVNRHQALHDALTGLPNRTLFRDRIEQAVLLDARTDGHTAVVMIDLDRFKEVNDTLGHQSGDELLRILADRLAAGMRRSDTVARLGGDEFGVLAHGLGSAEDAVLIGEKVRQALSGPAEVTGLLVDVDVSVGIALHPDDGDDVDELLRRADIALYESKALHEPVVYAREHDDYSPARLQRVADLRHAIEDGQIVVHYQPQALTETGEIESVEALVRWAHPEHGLIAPADFIPLAEHTGMIRPLTRHVLSTALRQCRAWHDRGWTIRMAVNVGARDLLDAAFPDEVLGCLEAAGLEPSTLELEITEDTIFSDAVRAYGVISKLNDRGVRFAVDDFGAGHSSLSYLKRLPVQVLKIDRSFVLGMTENADDAVIVQSTIMLGHNLRLRVVAEGVETAETQELLSSLGCDMIQGFHLGRPLPAEEIEALFATGDATHAAAG